jgi:hypothetical protein
LVEGNNIKDLQPGKRYTVERQKDGQPINGPIRAEVSFPADAKDTTMVPDPSNPGYFKITWPGGKSSSYGIKDPQNGDTITIRRGNSTSDYIWNDKPLDGGKPKFVPREARGL